MVRTRLTWGVALWVVLTASCRPALSPRVLAAHAAHPEVSAPVLLERSAGRRPTWLEAGPTADGAQLVAHFEAPDLDRARAGAARGLAEALARRLGHGAKTEHRARRGAGPQGEFTVAATSTRLGGDKRAVEPDATYWERIRVGGEVVVRAWARLRVSQASLQLARARARGPQGRPRVLVCLQGPNARALERALYFGAIGAIGGRWALVDPALARGMGACAQPQDAARDLGAAHLVQGHVSTGRGPMIALSTTDGPNISVRAQSFSELARVLPAALLTLLDPRRASVGPPRGRP